MESLSENLNELIPRLDDNVYGEFIKSKFLMYRHLVELSERPEEILYNSSSF